MRAIARKALCICEQLGFTEIEVEELPGVIEVFIKENRENKQFKVKLEKPAAEPEFQQRAKG